MSVSSYFAPFCRAQNSIHSRDTLRSKSHRETQSEPYCRSSSSSCDRVSAPDAPVNAKPIGPRRKEMRRRAQGVHDIVVALRKSPLHDFNLARVESCMFVEFTHARVSSL